jgi:colanic acid biosynthesis glycosyl transferase WcaI
MIHVSMRILVLALNYVPETTSSGPYTAAMAEHLASLGNDVRVITTFPMAPKWRVFEEYRGRILMKERIRGVSVLRLGCYLPKRPNRVVPRMLSELSFSIAAMIGAVSQGRPDAVLCISPPFLLGYVAAIVSFCTRAPLFLHIKDLVGELAIASGMARQGSALARLVQAAERFMIRRANFVATNSQGLLLKLEGWGIHRSRLSWFPDFVDLPHERVAQNGASDFRTKHGISENVFVVMYSGSIALKQGLETLIEAAAFLRAEPDILFVIVGEGPYLDSLKTRAEQLKLANVLFLPLQPRDGLLRQLKSANVLVLTQKKDVVDILFPGKLIFYMAASRACVVAARGDSDAGLVVREYNTGVVVPPEDPYALASAIVRLRDDSAFAESLGRNGPAVVQRLFDRQTVLSRFTENLESLIVGSS